MKKFENYCSNLAVLSRAGSEDLDNEFIISGIINKFSIQFDLCRQVLKDILRYEGCSEANSGSPREIIKTAYAVYDFMNESVWLSMLRSRNSMTHVYDGNEARRLVGFILSDYIPEFIRMQEVIEKKYLLPLEDE